jgi:hypothetical protein
MSSISYLLKQQKKKNKNLFAKHFPLLRIKIQKNSLNERKNKVSLSILVLKIFSSFLTHNIWSTFRITFNPHALFCTIIIFYAKKNDERELITLLFYSLSLSPSFSRILCIFLLNQDNWTMKHNCLKINFFWHLEAQKRVELIKRERENEFTFSRIWEKNIYITFYQQHILSFKNLGARKAQK